MLKKIYQGMYNIAPFFTLYTAKFICGKILYLYKDYRKCSGLCDDCKVQKVCEHNDYLYTIIKQLKQED